MTEYDKEQAILDAFIILGYDATKVVVYFELKIVLYLFLGQNQA